MAFTTNHEPEPYSRLDDAPDRPASTNVSTESAPAAPPEPPVANLIEGYRTKRMAWIAEAEDLARMRDDVRGAAERERMEIITRARERARAVISNARRNLLTLSAQVEASLGPADQPAPVAELFRGGTRRALGGNGHGNGGTTLPSYPPDGRWSVERRGSVTDGSRAELDSPPGKK